MQEDESLWFMVFPEGLKNCVTCAGTTYCNETIPISQGFGVKMNWSLELRHLLYPKSTGLFHAIQGLDSKVSCLFDMTIGYKGCSQAIHAYDRYTVPSVFFQGKGPTDIHVHVSKWEISSIPGFRRGGCARTPRHGRHASWPHAPPLPQTPR